MSKEDDQARNVLHALESMRGMSANDAAKWLESNHSSFNDTELAAIFSQSPELAGANRLSDPDVYQRLQAIAARGGLAAGKTVPTGDKLAEQAVTDAKLGDPLNADLDHSGTVTAGEKSLVDAAVKKEGAAAASAAKDAGASDTGAASVGAKTTTAITGNGIIPGTNSVTSSPPDFIVNQLTGGAQPSAGQEAAMVVTWNRYHPEAPVKSAPELYARMKNVPGSGTPINLADPHVVSILQAAVLGEDPTVQTSVKLAADRSMTIDASTYQSALQNLGLKPSDVAAFARAADRAKLIDASGQPNWQILAMIEKARNGGHVGVMEVDKKVKPDLTAGRPSDVAANAPTGEKVQPGILTHPYEAARATKTWQDALKYQEGLSRYDHNDELALVYTIDPALAARLAAAPKDKWAGADKQKLAQIEVSSGFGQLNNVGQGGLSINDYTDPETKAKKAQASALDQQAIDKAAYENDRNRDGIPDYKQQPKLDQTKVRQAAKDLYQSLFFAEPTDAELARLVGAANGAQAAGNGFDQTDPQAALEGAAKTSGAYSELYRNKPGGMSEAEYAQQFKSGVGDIAGAQANPEAIRAGLRTGQYQTAVGAAATGAGIFNNSTFMGRLAGAGQVFSEFT